GDTASVVWAAPTPADHAKFNVKAGKRVIFQLAASTTLAGSIVHIESSKLPTGVAFNSSDGTTARAKFDWTPEAGGDFKVQFAASTTDATGVKVNAPSRTYSLHVIGAAQPTPTGAATVKYPQSYTLTNDKVSHWAFVLARTGAR